MFWAGVLVGVIGMGVVAFFVCRARERDAYEQGLARGKYEYLRQLANETGLADLLRPGPNEEESEGETGEDVA